MNIDNQSSFNIIFFKICNPSFDAYLEDIVY